MLFEQSLRVLGTVVDPKGHSDSGTDGIDKSLPGSRLLTILLETANKEIWIYQILRNWLHHLQEPHPPPVVEEAGPAPSRSHSSFSDLAGLAVLDAS